MIKLTYCVRRRSDLSAEDFRAYWLRQHGPLVKKHASALRARRYVQSHTLDSDANALLRQSRGAAAAFDGITEVWWDGLEDFSAALENPEGQQAAEQLLEDEGRFIDLSASSVFLTEEHEIFSL
jgi:uncharacterized protein (TIGR02118 family)